MGDGGNLGCDRSKTFRYGPALGTPCPKPSYDSKMAQLACLATVEVSVSRSWYFSLQCSDDPPPNRTC